jgi:hypothetical protein
MNPSSPPPNSPTVRLCPHAPARARSITSIKRKVIAWTDLDDLDFESLAVSAPIGGNDKKRMHNMCTHCSMQTLSDHRVRLVKGRKSSLFCDETCMIWHIQQ